MSRGVVLDPTTGKPSREEPVVAEIAYYDRDAFMEQIEENLRLARLHPDIVALTRNKYYAGVRSVATAATLRAPACIIWNPHASSRIQCFEVWIANTVATAFNLSLTRATARGTASTTSTPAAGNAIENDSAPPSGFVIDTAWSVAPTISAVDMIRWNIPATIGAGVILPFPDPITIPFGTGLALIAATATIFQPCDVTWVIGD